MSVPLWLVLSLAVATVCGVYNAAIINEFKVPPFIATLGSMTYLTRTD